MTPRGRHVSDADRDVRQYLVRIAGTLGDSLGEDLVALYACGSLASGEFRRERSTIDLIGVLRDGAGAANANAPVQRLAASRPISGELNAVFVFERDARTFGAPESAVRIVDARERGVTLLGPPAQAIFGPVPWHAYVSALRDELARAERLAKTRPHDAVLIACRVLQGTTVAAMSAPGKAAAAEWALKSVSDEHRPAIAQALKHYRGESAESDAHVDAGAVRALLDYVRTRAQPAFDRACDDDEDGE